MRIVGGRCRGLRLADLGAGDEDARLRPTSDRVRESMFNMILNSNLGVPLAGARVLDLFAGTGALGLEALSRGASSATFVEQGNKALSLLRRNIDLTRSKDQATILRRDATKLGVASGPAHDLVFLDPPYGRGLAETALIPALHDGWISEDALIVVEENSALPPPAGFTRADTRKYGGTHVTFLRVGPGL